MNPYLDPAKIIEAKDNIENGCPSCTWKRRAKVRRKGENPRYHCIQLQPQYPNRDDCTRYKRK